MTLNLDRSTWTRVKFGDVIESVTDRVDDPSKAGVDRYVGLEHLDPGSMTVNRWGTPDQVEAQKLRFVPGDVIFGRRRAYQKKVARADFEGICSAHALVLRAKPGKVDPDFLPVFLSSDVFLDRAVKISVGSLSPTVNWKTLAVQEFDLPPLDEQKRIAQLMWAVEDAITSHRGLLLKADHLRYSIYSDFVQGGEIVEIRSYVTTIEAGSSPLGSPNPAAPDEFGVLKVSAVSTGQFVPGENKRLLDEAAFDTGLAVKNGDLLVSRANAMMDNVGVACIVDGDFDNLMLSDKTLRVVSRPGRSPRVLLEILRSRPFRQHVLRSAGGTGAKNISQAAILRGPAPVIAPEAEERLALLLGVSDDATFSAAAALRNLGSLRMSLMATVFGGSS